MLAASNKFVAAFQKHQKMKNLLNPNFSPPLSLFACVCAAVSTWLCGGCVLNRGSHRKVTLGMQETHQGVPEEFIFGIILPEEEFTVTAHGGLNLNHQLVVLHTSL